MRKWALALCLLCLVPLLTGCSELYQVENQAFALLFGMDLTESDEFELTLQIPKIAGEQGGSSSGGPQESNYLVYSTKGKTYEEAMALMQWAIPRRINLSQIRMVVVSENLARSEHFSELLRSMAATYRLYTAARFVVCEGSAKEFIQAEQPVISSTISNELTPMFENYILYGYIPDMTFADVYYQITSIYSDPLATLAMNIQPKSTQQTDAAPASVLIASKALGENAIESDHANRYLGAAIFRKGQMVGKFSGQETLLCNLLRGELQFLPYQLDDDAIQLDAISIPSIYIDTKVDPIAIHIELYFSTSEDHGKISMEKLKTAIQNDLLETIQHCQQTNVEPFRFSEIAAGSFLTIDEWQAFNWREKFSQAQIDIDIHIQRENA